MIRVHFKTKGDLVYSIAVEGHADYDDVGKDIVCAAVSSNTSMIVNGLKEVLKKEMDVKIDDNRIEMEIKTPDSDTANFIKAYEIEIKNIKEQYPENIEIIEEAY